jgi:hypothetical protein
VSETEANATRKDNKRRGGRNGIAGWNTRRNKARQIIPVEVVHDRFRSIKQAWDMVGVTEDATIPKTENLCI